MQLEEERLIELFHQFPHLWDKRHRLFKDKIAVENSWQTIAEVLLHDVTDCRDAWQNIRNRFIKERKIIKNLPSGSGQYTPKWPYYTSCIFLDQAIAVRKTKSNYLKINEKEKSLVPTSELWQEIVIEEVEATEKAEEVAESNENEGTLQREPEIEESSHYAQVTAVRSSSKVSRPQIPFKSFKRKPKGNSSLDNLVATCNTLGQRICSLVETEQTEDELFAASIAKALDRMTSKKKKSELKMQIMSVLTQYESDSD